MARRRRRGKGRLTGRVVTAILAVPALYLLAALVGSVVPVNRGWKEPARGTTIYIADNGIHADLILPAKAEGLDWTPLLPKSDFAAPDPAAQWIAFGEGEQHVYLNTPTWWDITPPTIWHALTGGPRVMHVEWVSNPRYSAREVLLRPEEYRRLWAAIRAEMVLDSSGRPVRITHPGYGPSDAFFRAKGRASALTTCNSWVAGRLRLAGVKTSIWPPFVEGLVWRYRRAQSAPI